MFLDRIAQLEEENKELKEKLSEVTMIADDEKQSIEHILELEEENKKLREDNRFLTKISKEYMEKENIIQVTEFTGLYKDDLEKENERLKEELEIATKCSSQEEGKLRKLEKENERLKKENEELQEYKRMYE